MPLALAAGEDACSKETFSSDQTRLVNLIL
jgi:hypothetical protein